MIYELLLHGECNSTTGKQLATALKCDLRTVTEQIERERRDGKPICATSTGRNAGYYLPETPEELETYCRRLYKRGGELFKTRRALLAELDKMKKEARA